MLNPVTNLRPIWVKSGLGEDGPRCPLSANSGHWRVLSGAPELIQARAFNSDKSFHPLVDYSTVISPTHLGPNLAL